MNAFSAFFRPAPLLSASACGCGAILSLLVAVAPGLRAEEVKNSVVPGPITRSVFNSPPAETPGGRNPFLPIGYVRPVAAPAVPVEVVPTVRPEQFVVTSFSLEPPPLVVINGRTYSVGEKIPVDATGNEFVTVRRIMDGAVILDHRGRTFRCESRKLGGATKK